MPTASSRPQVAPRSRGHLSSSVVLIAAFLIFAAHLLAVAPQRPLPAGATAGDTARLRKDPNPPAATPPAERAEPTMFDGSELQVIKLTMKQSDWELLRENEDNTYYPADVEWKASRAASIGVRSHGSGSRSKQKPALRLDFNRYVDQTFVGLKSVVLVNGIQDTSMMRQRLVFTGYAKLGVPAPRAVHARLFVNENYQGLYQLVESVDKVLLPRVFDTGKGNKEDDGYLYEYKWRGYYYWSRLGTDLQAYADRFEPRTHELDAPAVLYGPIERLITTTNDASDADFEARMAESFDLKKLVKFLAVENFFTDADGFLGDWGVNNLYLYRFEDDKTWALIPWDKDVALYDAEYDIFRHVDENVLAKRLLQVPALHAAYLDTMLACAALMTQPDSADPSVGWFEAEVRREHAQIRDAVYADRYKPYPDSDFDTAMKQLPSFGKTRAAFVTDAVAKARRTGRIAR